MDLIVVLGALSGLAVAATIFRLYLWLPLGIVSALVLIAWEVPEPPTMMYALGTRVTVVDALTSALTVLTVQELLRSKKKLGPVGVAIVFQVLIALLSVAAGVAIFEVGTAFNEARIVLLPILLLFWALVTSRTRAGSQKLEKWIVLTAWLLVLVAAYHGFARGIGDADSASSLASGEFQTGRILVSGQAMFVAIGLFVSAARASVEPKTADLASIAVFFTVVVLSQHRTVWIATAVGLLMMWGLSNKLTKERTLVAAAVALLLLMVLQYFGAGSQIFSLLADSFSSDKTIGEREDSWVQLFEQYTSSTAQTLLTGFPFGTGFERVDGNGVVVTFQPHNWYLTLLIRVGSLGLLAWLVMVGVSLLRAINAKNQQMAGVLTAVTVFGWAYGINWYIAICLGYAIGRLDYHAEEGLPPARRAAVYSTSPRSAVFGD